MFCFCANLSVLLVKYVFSGQYGDTDSYLSDSAVTVLGGHLDKPVSVHVIMIARAPRFVTATLLLHAC